MGFGVDHFVFEEFAEGFEDFFGFFACLVGDFLKGEFSAFQCVYDEFVGFVEFYHGCVHLDGCVYWLLGFSILR